MKVIKVYRNGPRFWVGLIKEGGKKLILKRLLDFENSWAKDALKKEAAFFAWGNEVSDTVLRESLPRLIDFRIIEEKELWYKREYLGGEFQNKSPSRFILKKSFFRKVSPLAIVKLLAKLQEVSTVLPLGLTKRFARYHLKDFEHFTAWERVDPVIIPPNLCLKIGKLLDEKREVFNRNQDILTHFEFYGTHLLLTPAGKLKVIDWENVGWGNIAHDFTTIWLRAYPNPSWQSGLLSSFRKTVGRENLFDDLLRVEVILQSLGNIRFFSRTKEPLEVAERERAISFFRQTIEDALHA